ncbi:MAG: hypothetical protein NZM37_11880, partial [Sandaracinaceae bacterium]|nr:hypothetical protein [Sandaracinaceae bacterium]
MRFLYFGLPLGLEILRRHGWIPRVACLSDGEGLARARKRVAPISGPAGRVLSIPLGEAPLLLKSPDLHSQRVFEILQSARPQAIFVWFWPKRIPSPVLELAPLGAFGVHPSLLPRHRGPDPFFHAIRAGDLESGVSLYRLDAEYDSGPIVEQLSLPIAPDENAGSLARKLDRLGLGLLLWAIERLAAGDPLQGRPQDPAQATFAPLPSDEDLAIDWTRSSEEILRLIRAAYPTPLASAQFGEALVFIRKAIPYTGPMPCAIEVKEAILTPSGVAIRCGEGAIEVIEVERGDGLRLRGA